MSITYYSYPRDKDKVLSKHFKMGEFVSSSDYTSGNYPSSVPIHDKREKSPQRVERRCAMEKLPAMTVEKMIGDTVYVVEYVIGESARESAYDKVKKLVLREAGKPEKARVS